MKITNGYQLDLELIPPVAENKTSFKEELFVNLKDGDKLPIRFSGRYLKIKRKPGEQS